MDNEALARDEFLTLRDEIKATKARLFWIVVMGLFGVPMLTYLATKTELFVWLLLPFSILVLILLFLAEQSSMMRAGRYIRERIECAAGRSLGWEGWVESMPRFRYMDKQYVASFMIVFFAYYFMTIGVSIQIILAKEATDMTGSGLYWYWFFGAIAAYAVGAVWALFTLRHHWKATVSTAGSE
ncbi:MAG TPA: hypothetical protein VM243_01655 [Phycisphaerae bacterium]|nr:hypothetical protein [Phycisphaerae bacterium]